MQSAFRRGGRGAPGLLAAGLLVATVGCSDLPLVLEVAEGSTVTLEVPGQPPVTTAVRGMVRTRATLPVDLDAALAGEDLVGTVRIEEILLAGGPVEIAGISSGFSCTSLASESLGSIAVNALQGLVRIDAVANNRTQFLAPRARELGAVVLSNPLQTEVSVDLATLIDVLGGGALPIDFIQPIDDVSEESGPLQGTRLFGDIRFRSPPGDLSSIPGLDDCREFLAETGDSPEGAGPELARGARGL